MDAYPHLLFKKHWEISPGVYYEVGQCRAIISAICEMPLRPEYHQQLLQVSLIKGAQATTAIEGNTLTEEEIERVAQGQDLPPSKEYQQTEVRNILEATNLLLGEVVEKENSELMSPDLIKRFHKMIGKDLGDHFDAIPGLFREDERIVGSYRCPRHEDVSSLVDKLCDWLLAEFHYGAGNQGFTDAVVQAIITHIYIEWIHPFGDGNGRTGRLLEFYILLRAGNPDIASHILSNFYNETRPEYYRQLDRASRNRDLSNFIAYAVQGFRDGLFNTLHTIQQSQFETAWRSFVYDKFAVRKYRKKNVFKRQRELILQMHIGKGHSLDEMILLSPGLAREYANLTKRTILRDIAVLKEMELLRELDGEYVANSGILKFQMARHLQNVL